MIKGSTVRFRPMPNPSIGKRKFSGFTKEQAFKLLGLKELTPWHIPPQALAPSDFFHQHIQRLQRNFDLEGYEESKKLLIDAICDEAIDPLLHLKIWKGAKLESIAASGFVDYLIAERQRYLSAPMLCIIEAKKDNFEQGLAQCLVEMQACQWSNQQINRSVDVLGIVSNGSSWQFYKLITSGEVFESPAYSTGDMELLLGRLRFVFELCQQALMQQ
jgi:hypothetical protein